MTETQNRRGRHKSEESKPYTYTVTARYTLSKTSGEETRCQEPYGRGQKRASRQPHPRLERMASFCAKALQRLVFPVPGGPCRRTVRLKETRLGLTPFSEKSRAVSAYCSSRCLTSLSNTRLSHRVWNSRAGNCHSLRHFRHSLVEISFKRAWLLPCRLSGSSSRRLS